MDLEIHTSNRARKYHQRGLRNGEVNKTKQVAIRDIAQECGKGKLYSRNYLHVEFQVLQMKKYLTEIIHLSC